MAQKAPAKITAPARKPMRVTAASAAAATAMVAVATTARVQPTPVIPVTPVAQARAPSLRIYKKVTAIPAMVVKTPSSKPVTIASQRVVRSQGAQKPVASGGLVPIPKGLRRRPKTSRIVNGRRYAIRCSGQKTPAHSSTGPNVWRASTNPTAGYHSSSVSSHQRIVPRKVYETPEAQYAYIPPGYKPAWKDDRLNPYRGIQTAQGHMDTQRVWTNTLPRQFASQTRRHTVKPPIVVYRGTGDYPLPKVRHAYSSQARYRTDVTGYN